MQTPSAHPVLSPGEAQQLEARLLGGDEAREWAAMSRAGEALGRAVLADFCELGAFPAGARLLVLAGKGHNAGDALLAAKTILARYPQAQVEVCLFFGERSLRPLALRAYRELQHDARGRVGRVAVRALAASATAYDVCVDGVFGFQFRPPIDVRISNLLAHVNGLPIRFRAAVDLPSGLGEPHAFRADFTYATGSVKAPVLAGDNAPTVGRLRYLDLGFFAENVPAASDTVLTPEVLAPLRTLRPPGSDKRSYGHVFIVGGSRSYPGAVLMCVRAALRSGVGLLTAFVPESLVPAFAAVAPEAIWVGWPETPEGGLALEGLHLFRTRAGRADALVIGPGLGREPETLALASELVKTATIPLVLDADALQPDVVLSGNVPRVLTPHAGEFARLSAGKTLKEFCAKSRAITVLKGPVTRVSDGASVWHSLFGGPVLARGGSGDLLAGMIGGLLAGTPGEPLLAACRGVVWHGLAADALARMHGQVAVNTTQLLDFLPAVLREEPA
jgi:ADP-dependent NAD(P)H-hydrate dehydratase / NAD(P)H-hydrate epimerase